MAEDQKSAKPLRIAVLASGTGTTLQAVIDACESGDLDARVVVVISNNSDAGALERARRHRIPDRHLSGRTHSDPAALDRAIAAAIGEHHPDLVLLAGYTSVKWQIGAREGRLAELRSEQADLAKAVKDGQPTLKVAEAFDGWLRTRADPLHVMADWNARSPSTDRVFMRDLEFVPAARSAPAKLLGNGFAREREDVVEWFVALEAAGYRVAPDLVERTGLNPDFPFQFYLVVDLPQPADEPAVPPRAQASR